jgi:opacity protein-like surface antigen
MRKAIVLVVAMFILSAGSAMAQGKVEVSALIGYTLSDGVTGSPVKAPNGKTYDAIDLKDSMNWGLMVGINATPNVEVGFLFNQQMSTLRLEGTSTTDVGDMKVGNYHGYFAYNFGDADAKARLYILGGVGATYFPGVAFTTSAGVQRATASSTRFSSTFGAGIKMFPSPRIGLRAGFRWTPTYIKSDATGWWCDPYWGCYVTGDAQYANQFDFSGGVVFRF